MNDNELKDIIGILYAQERKKTFKMFYKKWLAFDYERIGVKSNEYNCRNT